MILSANNDIKVVIVEDDSEIREMLQEILKNSSGFSCEHTFSDCESAVKHIPEILPDVVLMDIELPGINGIEGLKKLSDYTGNIDFIMLTIRDDEDAIFRSLCSGAVGYLLKDTPPSVLLSAIREVKDGGSPISPGIARKITMSFKPSAENPLSARETEILEELCEGHNYNVIAEKLFLSGHTVRAHIKNIYRKLNVNSRGAAVKKAMKDKLI